jgi:hypothetical protein
MLAILAIFELSLPDKVLILLLYGKVAKFATP